MFVFLAGNLSDGFTCYGPYDTIGVCYNAHEFEEGWVMETHIEEGWVMETHKNRTDES